MTTKRWIPLWLFGYKTRSQKRDLGHPGSLRYTPRLAEVYFVDGVAGGEGHAVVGEQSQADEIAAGDDE